jgi:hypothetical protein
VTLFTGRHLAGFYERFGFAGPDRLCGMSLMIEGRPGVPDDAAKGEAR